MRAVRGGLSPGQLHLIREVDYASERLIWEELRCDFQRQGASEGFDEAAYCAEIIWRGAADRLLAGACLETIAASLRNVELAWLHGVAPQDRDQFSRMMLSMADTITQLPSSALFRLEDCGIHTDLGALKEAVTQICDIRALAAGMTRHEYCSHVSHRPQSAMIATLLDPAINLGTILGEAIALDFDKLIPLPKSGLDEAAGVLQARQISRISALRPRLWHHKPERVAPAPSQRRQSRFAQLSCAEAARELLAASPHMRGLKTDHPTLGISWSSVTLSHFNASAKLIDKMFQNRPLASLQFADWAALFAILDRLPKTHHRSSADAEKSLEGICESAAQKVASGEMQEQDIGLGPAAINRHISGFRTIYAWLGERIEVPSIEWAQFRKPLPRVSRDRGYFAHQLEAIFALPVYTGRASPFGELVPGDTVWHNAGYWVFILVVYSGARLGEVCGLLLDEIRESHGICYMAMRHNGNRLMKRAASVRDVPLHSEVIRLGFLEFVAAMREAGETMLFPELKSPTGRPMAGGFHELHGRFMAGELEFMGDGGKAHPARHYVNDALKLAEISLVERQALLGHQGREDRRARVSSLANLKRLQSAIHHLPVVTGKLDPATILLHPHDRRLRGVRTERQQVPIDLKPGHER